MKNFYAKLLLFGEYTIIKGSSALAIPYQRYSGEWIFSKNPTQSNKILQQWLVFLEEQHLDFNINLSDFRTDVHAGLTFLSDIPQGYGVGSSGALCAALFHRYVTHFHNKKIDIFSLKNHFFQLEHFFHGGGSGVDPLVCYLNRPIVLESNSNITFPQQNFLENAPSSAACFLINTHIERKTEPLVKLFLEKCEDVTFNSKCENELAIYTNEAIQALNRLDNSNFFSYLERISIFQYEHFLPMIPSHFQQIWKEGIDSSNYSLKLCGAGGGGFILGFTKDWQVTQRILSDSDLEFVFYL